jgi:diguanylate cyclase (GGDEF)-like protein
VPAPRARPREANLVVVYGTDLGRRIAVQRTVFTIGRSTKCDLFIDHEAVSRAHAEIIHESGRHVIVDLRSRNGTRVNDERITERALEDGDRIQVGRTLLSFLSGAEIETRYQEEIYRLMTMDGLTAVYNKRYLSETLEREQARAIRYERPLSLILFEVDGLKAIRAAHGAIASDGVLQRVAAAIRGKLRQQDIFGRLDGGSFGIVLPEIDAEGAHRAAEKTRLIVEAMPKSHEGKELAFALSLGVVTAPRGPEKPGELWARAKEAVAEAQAEGGDRVVAFQEEPDP